MDVQVRYAQPTDAESIVAILNPIIEAGIFTAFDIPFTVESEREYILNFPNRGVFHVAVRNSDQRVVGFQSMEPFAYYTHAFDHVGVLGTYVDLQCRRQGVATRLFGATFQAAIEKGVREDIYVCASRQQGRIADVSPSRFQGCGNSAKTGEDQRKLRGRDRD